MGVYCYLKEWIKNPHWSFSCCLALVLPLNDLRGEMKGLDGMNVLQSQLKTGDMEMSTIMIAVESSGVNVNLEGEESGHKQGDRGDDGAKFMKKRNKATQTDFLRTI